MEKGASEHSEAPPVVQVRNAEWGNEIVGDLQLPDGIIRTSRPIRPDGPAYSSPSQPQIIPH